MSVDLQASSHQLPDATSRSIGSARAVELWQHAADSVPAAVLALPGDPIIAQRAGCVSGSALLVSSLLGAFGVFQLQSSAIAHLTNVYGLALAVLTLTLKADLPQAAVAKEAVITQARFLGAPAGVAALHLVQCSLAFSQGSVGFILAGLTALAAGMLELTIWYMRSSAMRSNDTTGLIDGQSEPLPAESRRNLDVMLQQC